MRVFQIILHMRFQILNGVELENQVFPDVFVGPVCITYWYGKHFSKIISFSFEISRILIQVYVSSQQVFQKFPNRGIPFPVGETKVPRKTHEFRQKLLFSGTCFVSFFETSLP